MRLRLVVPHYVDDLYLEAGMEVGDGEGARHSWKDSEGNYRKPSDAMEGLDDEGRKFIESSAPHAGDPVENMTTEAPLEKLTKPPRPG